MTKTPNDRRITRDYMYLLMAEAASQRSTCYRLQVGCLIVDTGTMMPVAMGYNGPPPKVDHCTGNNCQHRQNGVCVGSLHAEENALDRLPFVGRPRDIKIYVTHSPCPHCVEKILHCGHNVRGVYFKTEFRDTTALRLLGDKGIPVYRMTSSGFVIDMATGELCS